VVASWVCALVLATAHQPAQATWAVPPALLAGALAIAAWMRGLTLSPGALWGAALAVRVPFLLGAPLLSDDLYRYLWEGEGLGLGIDVFSVPPNAIGGRDPELQRLIRHPDMGSFYPPIALAWFRAVAPGGVLGIRIATVAVDLITLAALWAWRRPAKDAGAGLDGATLWALHPLAAIAAAHGAHVDVVGAATAAVGVAALHADAGAVATLALALGAGTRLLPGLLMPALHQRVSTSRAAGILAGVVVLGGLALGESLYAGTEAFRSALAIADGASFNGFVFAWMPDTLASRWFLRAAGMIAVALAWLPPRDPARMLGWLGPAFVLLTPVAPPTYGLWALLPAALLGSPWRAVLGTGLIAGWLALGTDGGATPPETWGAPAPDNSAPAWVWWVTWSPFLAAATIALAQRAPRPRP
jgi:hypothetical protein